MCLLIGAVLLSVALAGCASLRTPSRDSPENGAIYGYFEIPKDSIGYLSDMSFFTYPPKVKAYFGRVSDLDYVIVDGAFFAYNAAPGSYFLQMIFATASDLFGTKTNQLELIPVKAFDAETNNAMVQKNLITVKSGELVFVGAREISLEKKPGFFSFQNGSFSIGPARSPSEKEILQKLSVRLKGTPWEAPAAARIAALQ